MFVFNQQGCQIYHNKDCKIIGDVLSAFNDKGMYKLDINNSANVYTTLTCSTADLWHKRLGHLCRYGMKLMQNGLVAGVKITGENKETCITCLEGKQARCPFKKINYHMDQ